MANAFKTPVAEKCSEQPCVAMASKRPVKIAIVELAMTVKMTLAAIPRHASSKMVPNALTLTTIAAATVRFDLQVQSVAQSIQNAMLPKSVTAHAGGLSPGCTCKRWHALWK